MQLFIYALEGGFYVVKLTTKDERKHSITDVIKLRGIRYRPQIRFKSVIAIKNHFSKLHFDKVILVHNNAYDQMIGLPSSQEQYQQRLNWSSRHNLV